MVKTTHLVSDTTLRRDLCSLMDALVVTAFVVAALAKGDSERIDVIHGTKHQEQGLKQNKFKLMCM